MAEQIEQIILDVKFETTEAARNLAAVNASLNNLRAQQKALKEEIKSGNDEWGKNSSELAKVEQSIKLLTASQKALSVQMQDTAATAEGLGDSYMEINAQVRALENQYKSLSKAQRESAEGEALKKAIIQQKEALKEFDHELVNDQRNVGNYEGALAKIFPTFGKLSAAAKSAGVDMSAGTAASGSAVSKFAKIAVGGFAAVKAAIIGLGKALLANPILALIAAAIALVVGAIKKLTDAFKKNDDAMTNLSKAFAIFKPIGTAIGKVFDTLAESLSKVVLGLASAATAVGKFLEKIKLLPSGTTAAVEAAQALVQAEDDLQEAERNYTVESAKRQKEIAQLRDEAAQSKDVEERMSALKCARDLEEENLQEAKRIADERLRIAREVAKQNNDTTDETKDKIAQLEAAAIQAETAFYDGVRRLDQSINNAEKEIEKERQQRAKAAAERRKQQLDAERELYRTYEDTVVAMIEDETERTYEQRRLQGEREIADLQTRLETDKTLTAKAREELSAIILNKQQLLQDDLLKIKQDALEKEIEEERKAREKEEADAKAASERRRQQRIADLQKQQATEQQRRTIAQAEQEREAGTNAIRLAQIRTDAALDEHQRLLEMDDETKMALYATQEEYELAMIESEKRISEAYAAEQDSKIAEAEKWSGTVMNMASAATDLANTLGQRELAKYTEQNTKKKDELDKRLAAGLISQEDYDKQVAELDAELAEKQKEQNIKAAKRAKAIAIMEAVINMALGISKAVSENPMLGGLPGSAIAATMGAIQIATIAAEPLPTAGRGKLLKGKSHAQGGIPIEAEGGEAIINKRSTAMFRPILSAINQAGGGVKFAQGGMVGEEAFADAMQLYGGSNYEMLAAAMTEAVSQMPSPTMVYSEFENFQQQVVINNEFASL